MKSEMICHIEVSDTSYRCYAESDSHDGITLSDTYANIGKLLFLDSVSTNENAVDTTSADCDIVTMKRISEFGSDLTTLRLAIRIIIFKNSTQTTYKLVGYKFTCTNTEQAVLTVHNNPALGLKVKIKDKGKGMHEVKFCRDKNVLASCNNIVSSFLNSLGVRDLNDCVANIQ